MLYIILIILVILVAMLSKRLCDITHPDTVEPLGGYIGGGLLEWAKKKRKAARYKASIRREAVMKKEEADLREGKKNKVINVADRILSTYTTGISKFILREYCKDGVCDLNKLWEDKCGPNRKFTNDSPEAKEWQGSLFCAMGEGNELANLIFRLRFTVPETPSKHALYNFVNKTSKSLTGNDKADELLHEFVATLLANINRNKVLRWADLPSYAVLAAKFPIIKKKYIEPALKKYGLSISPQPVSNTADTPNRAVDLNELTKKCKPEKDGTRGPWQDTIFCALAGTEKEHHIASMLAALKFQAAPEDTHIVTQIMKVAQKSIEEIEKAADSTWTGWAKGKAAKYIAPRALLERTELISRKMSRGEPLSWNDLNDLFVVGSIFGVGGWNLLDVIESNILEPMGKVGLDLAPNSV